MRTEIHGAPEWDQKWQSVDWFFLRGSRSQHRGMGGNRLAGHGEQSESEGGGSGGGNAPVRVDVAVEREDGGGRLRLHPGDRAGRPAAPHGLVPAHRRRRQQQREQRHKHEAASSGRGPPRSHGGRTGLGQAESSLGAGEEADAASCYLSASSPSPFL